MKLLAAIVAGFLAILRYVASADADVTGVRWYLLLVSLACLLCHYFADHCHGNRGWLHSGNAVHRWSQHSQFARLGWRG